MGKRSMCIICRKKRYKEKTVGVTQSVVLFPYKIRVFHYNVCTIGCIEAIKNIDLQNSIEIVQPERTI